MSKVSKTINQPVQARELTSTSAVVRYVLEVEFVSIERTFTLHGLYLGG
jgi:hypothetical protein